MNVDALVRESATKLARRHAVVAAIVDDQVTIHGASVSESASHGAQGGAPDPASLFEIGSVTKVFTSLALACAVTRGDLRLDQPVGDLLPGVAPGVHNITLEQLATHTSGLPKLPAGLLPRALLPMTDPYARFTSEVLLAGLPRIRVSGTGQKWRYSNLGGGLLGLALATHAGRDYDQLIQDEIGVPLGLADTVVVPDHDQAARTVAGHTRWGRRTSYWNMAALAGAGGLRSTADDLARFVRAQMDGSSLAEAVMLTQQPRHRVNRRLSMGLGWVRLSLDGREIIWHNGGTGGFRSFVGFEPASSAGVVALANTTHSVDGPAFKLLKQLAAHPTAH